jgi:hypothetical protein
MGAVLCLATGCATVEARATCPDLEAGNSVVRSPTELQRQLATGPDHRVEPDPNPSCSTAQFDDVDWDTQAVAVLPQTGSSTVERMTVRGKKLMVVRRGLRQRGGQELFTWSGSLLVVVPVEVEAIEYEFRNTRPCPNRRGPTPP